jgi:hypothetical protein
MKPASARTSMYTVALYHRNQKIGAPQPLFTYAGSSDSGWTAKVSFPGLDVQEIQELQNEGRYSSKQEAKEALSKIALETLEIAAKEGKPEKFSKSKGPVQEELVKKSEPSLNYIGQLLGKCSTT